MEPFSQPLQEAPPAHPAPRRLQSSPFRLFLILLVFLFVTLYCSVWHKICERLEHSAAQQSMVKRWGGGINCLNEEDSLLTSQSTIWKAVLSSFFNLRNILYIYTTLYPPPGVYR